MELTPEALRVVAAWLDLTDQLIHNIANGVPVKPHIMDFIIKTSAWDDMQTDIRRWADEMELDN